MTTSIDVKHGYTLDDLHRLTGIAVRADRSMALGVADARDIAWSAIAEYLCVAENWPHQSELVQAGWQAIYKTVRDGYRSRGYKDGDYGVDGAPTMSRFVRFWGSGVTPSHEDSVIDRVAMQQILPTLVGAGREAVVALAVHEDYKVAADSLGIKYSTLTVRLVTARRHVLGLWHEGETPHRPNRIDRRVESHTSQLSDSCGNNHEWTPENTRTRSRMVRGKIKRERVCRLCEQARSARRPHR